MINSIERSHSFEQSSLLAQSNAADAAKAQQKKVADLSKASGKLSPEGGNSLQPQEQQKSVDVEELDNVVETLNQYISNSQRSISFSLETDLNQTIIKVVNSKTDELIRQIPSEEAIALAKALRSSSEAYVLNEQGLIIETDA